MTAPRAPRFVAVLDGTTSGAERQARALGGFLRAGVTWGQVTGAATGSQSASDDPVGIQPAGVTVAFYADEAGRDRLLRGAPTRDVYLVRTTPRRPDLMAAALTAFAADADTGLIAFAGGPLGTELAARLARRTGGGAVTEALDAAVEAERLVCRRSVYSNHLTGWLALGPRPWCVTTDARWYDSPEAPPAEHEVVADVDARPEEEPGGGAEAPFDAFELLEPPASGDLETARFVVVAGRGAGSREGADRVAAAARRMGAVFGVTRPVAMNAWAPTDRLIGVSGARTAPPVCLVAGASGAPAFLWGIERAGFIAAVDQDERAAIVSESDAAVLDDCVAVIEALADIASSEHS